MSQQAWKWELFVKIMDLQYFSFNTVYIYRFSCTTVFRTQNFEYQYAYIVLFLFLTWPQPQGMLIDKSAKLLFYNVQNLNIRKYIVKHQSIFYLNYIIIKIYQHLDINLPFYFSDITPFIAALHFHKISKLFIPSNLMFSLTFMNYMKTKVAAQ